MMLKKYTTVEVDIYDFEDADVITTSGQDVELDWEGLPTDKDYIFG